MGFRVKGRRGLGTQGLWLGWWLPKTSGTFWQGPMIRTIVCWGLS